MPNQPKVTTQHGHAKVGAPATFRVGGMPPLPPPKADETRKISPDATGYYEADPGAPMWNANRTLHLNQAGHALVGWFRTPPKFVRPIQDFSVGGKNVIPNAVLLASLNPIHKTSQGFPFWYKEFTDPDGKDPDSVLSPFTPWDHDQPPLSPDPEGLREGRIQIRPHPDGWDRPDEFFTQRLIVTLTFILPDASDSPPITLIHKAPYARASERAIPFQHDSLKRVLIVRHRNPIPSTFFDTSKESGRVWRDARSLFATDSTGPLAQQIAEYQDHLGDGPGETVKRKLARDKIETILLSHFPWSSRQDDDYNRFLLRLLLRDAATNTLTIKGQTKTYRDWLAAISVNELNQKSTYPSVFNGLMAGSSIRRYDFEFSQLSKSKQLFPAVKGAAGGFKVKITANSASMRSDGKMPSDDEFHPIAKNNLAEYFGAFLELKGGVGDPPKLPKTVSFYTSEQLDSTDFDGAYFTISALDASAGASVGVSNPIMNPRIGVKSGGDTQLIRVHAHGQVLEGTCAEGSIKPEFETSKGFKMPDGDTLKRIFSKTGSAEDSDFFSISKGVKVTAGASLGIGYIGTQQKFASWMRAAPRPGTRLDQAEDARTLSAGFEKDSAVFTGRKENNWELRFLLETVLATDLALFAGVADVDCDGYASPEYTPQHNLILSQKRANAVLQVVDDAVGPLYPDTTSAVGLGDSQDMFRGKDGKETKMQESDPTGDLEQRKKFEKEHQEEVAQWPLWRKVEINIRGHFAVHVVTVEGSDNAKKPT